MYKELLRKLRNASENDKIVYRNVIGAFVVKGGALFVTMYTLPAYIKFFHNDEVLGLWFVILSLLQWILNFDLGIGNGMRNYLSEALALDQLDSAQKYVSSAYYSIGAIVAVLSIVFPFVIRNVDLNSLMNIDPSTVSPETLYTAAVIVFIGVMVQFWLKLINSVLYALQKSSVNNCLALCTNVLILLFALLYTSSDNNANVIAMAFSHAVAVALPLLIVTFMVFARPLKGAAPRLRDVSFVHIKRVLTLGGVFFFIQIAYMVVMSTNEFLITKTSGNSYNVPYQSYYKLFSLGSTIFALAMTPIWSVITKAKSEKNVLWIRRTYKRFARLGGLFCLGEVLLIPLMPALMRLWLMTLRKLIM